MTYYLGSKAKHADAIVAVTCENRRKDQTYAEVFAGGGNVLARVKDGPRIANDLNWRMMALLDAAGNKGWQPPEDVTQEEFDAIKLDPDSYPPELVAYIANITFGSKWFDIFTPNDFEKNRGPKWARQSLLRDAPGLKGVKFYSMRYEDFTQHIPPNSIVYCDPPYAGTTGYGGAKTNVEIGQSLSLNTWNRSAFWRWADGLVESGHRVFVSEYSGPPPAIYPESDDLKAEKLNCTTRFKLLQQDTKSKREDREAAAKAIRDVEDRIKKDRERTAARWQTMWEKEVVSSFDSGRGDEGKREVEKLFHRAP